MSDASIRTPIPQGLVRRVVAGMRYMITGAGPEAWFGPFQPLQPMAPPTVAGRQFDYPVGYNLIVTPRGDEAVGFHQLRALADQYDLLRLVIETRKDQMERLHWTIRRRCPPAGEAGNDDARIAGIEEFFRLPDRVHFWSTWLRQLLEDLFVLDAPALYLRRTRAGRLYALEPIDGSTIKRLINADGRTPAPPDPAYQQVLHGLPAVDLTTRDLLYRPRNLRTHRLYGYSPVEQIVMTVNIALRRQLSQLGYYTEGNVPEALIGTPESWSPQQIKEFQQYWDALLEGNLAQRRHAKFVPGGVAKTFIPTREPELKGAFDEWLARVVCFAFSVSPQALMAQMNRATAETAQDTALAEGLAPVQAWVKQLIDYVLITEFDAPDLEFQWRDDREIDPQRLAGIAQVYVTNGIKSVNEVRREIGLEPVAGGEAPLVFTGSGPVPLAQAAAGQGAGAAAPLGKYSLDQLRNWHGRWTSEGGAGESEATADNRQNDDAFMNAKPVQIADASEGISDAGGILPAPANSNAAGDANAGASTASPVRPPTIPPPPGTGNVREYSPEDAAKLPPPPSGSQYVTLNDGSVVWSAYSNHGAGGPMLMPADVSLAADAQQGEQLAAFYRSMSDSDLSGAPDYRNGAMAGWFFPGHGSKDYQSAYGNDGTYNRDYVDVTNYDYGVMAAAFGYSEDEALEYAGKVNRWSDLYEQCLHGAAPKDTSGPYGNKVRNAEMISRGYRDYATGRIVSPAQ